MARYRVLYWREIPSLVEAFEGDHAVRTPLSQRFQDLIDTLAMRTGASSAEAYLEGWRHGAEADRPGTPERVAEEVTAELEASFERLLQHHLLGPSADPQ
ncbi:MAG: virulence factor [Candidatus Rokubacteria bacterium]|nr:virulence factor [Candidatus Rokubacteria bacterium]